MAASADTFTHASRLATGDWVVLRRPDQGPLGFVGKVTDGEWDPRDDALLRARVDTTRSKPVWFAAGDLERVSPSDEAALVEVALARGLVPPERAARLRADLAAVRERTLTFVRSPGLLDRLWAALPTEPEQRSGGLAAFFDEGQRELQDARFGRPAAAAPAAPLSVLPDDFEIEAPEPVPSWRPSPDPVVPGPMWRRGHELLDPASVPVAATRPSSRREAVARILDSLLGTLQGLVGRLERLDLRTTSDEGIRGALVAADLPLPTLLEAISPRRLRQVPPLLGLAHVPGLADRTIQAWILATFRDAPASPPSAPEPLAPLPPWREPLLPRSEFEAKWRVLGLVRGRGRELHDVCERAGVALSEGSRSSRELCLAIATSPRRDLRRLLFALPVRTLVHVPWILGLPPIDGPGDRVVEELIGRWPPMTSAGPARVLDLEDVLLPHIVRVLTLAELTLVLLNLRSLAPVDPAGLVATLRAEGHGVRDLLSHLGPGALRRVATAVGVPEAIKAPEQLHAAILSLEPSPFA